MSRGLRHRVEPGVFRDAIGLSATVKVDGRQVEKRFPAGTALRTIREWRRSTRARLELSLALPAEAPPPATLAEDVARYLALLPDGASKNDVTMLLGHWAREHGDAPRSALTAASIQAQLLAWRRDGAAVSTCNHRRRALVALTKALDGPGAPNPAAEVPKLPEPRREPRGLPWPLIRRILVALPDRSRPERGKARGTDSRTKARLWVLATTGWPHAVLARLEPRDLHLTGPTPHAVIRPRRKGRGARARTLPLTPDAVRALRRWLAVGATGAFSRSSLRKSFLVGVRRARQRWEAAERRAAAFRRRAPRPWPVPDDVRVYDLRHSFGARALIAANGDLLSVKDLMMHESLTTTEQYVASAVALRTQITVAAMGRR